MEVKVKQMKKLIKVLLIVAAICLIIAFATSPVAESSNDSMKGIIVDKGWDDGYFIEVVIGDDESDDYEDYIIFVSPEENEQLDIGDEYEW